MSDEREALRARVRAHVEHESGGPVEVRKLEPLAGGACQESWLAELHVGGAERRLVLRGDARTSLPGSLDRTGEQRVVQAAVAAGVRTPAARWLGRDLLRAGSNAYFMDWVSGEAIGRRVVKGPHLEAARVGLGDELARELAKIHSITPANNPSLFDRTDGKSRTIDPAPGQAAHLDPVGILLVQTVTMLDALGEPRPAIELALRWLQDRRPASSEVTLVHGDFRVGNFLVTPSGLAGILDWEFSRWGTPAEDLAWISVRDWRFGRNDFPVGGISKREPFYAAYEAASGRPVDRDQVLYWEVFGNLRWALGSLHQGLRYHAGDRDLELIAVARRAAEMEYEALRLIDKGRL